MGLFSDKKPYTAISAECEALLRAENQDDQSRLVTLVENIQSNHGAGGNEAGRIIRKKLKYGTPSEQRRALSLAETIVDNGVKTSTFVTHSGLGDQIVQLAAQHNVHKHADMSKAVRVSKQSRALLLDWSHRRDANISGLFKRAGLVEKADRHRPRSGTPEDDLDAEVFGEDGRRTPPEHRAYSHRRAYSSSSYDGEPESRSATHSRSGSALSWMSPKSRSHSRSHSRSQSQSQSHSRSRSNSRSAPYTTSRSPSPTNLRASSLEGTIAAAHNISTRLTNALIASPNGSRDTDEYYRQATQLRHRVVKLVHDPSREVQSYIGQLLSANEELVAALQAHDAVVKDGEQLEARDDHDLLHLDDDEPPARSPPPVGNLHFGEDNYDPFADQNEAVGAPVHTPLW